MKAEDINPIVQAVMVVGSNFFKQKPELGELFVQEKSYHSDNLIVNIGITGDITGQCILSFNNESIKKVAEAMIGTEIEQIDEMAKSAVSEFCNMVMGNAATNFSNINRRIDISYPVTIEGNMSISSNRRFLGLPFSISQQRGFEILLFTESI